MKKLSELLSIVLCIVLLLSITSISAFAVPQQEKSVLNNLGTYGQENYEIEYLSNGDRIISATYTVSNPNSRAYIVTKSNRTWYENSKGEELASFTIFGDFNSATGECVNHYHKTSTSGGSWRVEDASSWRSTYAVDGSCNFVQRILGVKFESITKNVRLTY